MAPPAVAIYVTSLTSQPKVRQQTELLRRALRALEIPYTEHDCFADEEAKIRWQRAKPPGRVIGLPGFTVGGEFIGTVEEFEDANETGTLPEFLRQDTDLAGNTSIGEAELEKLMREMTADDLDALAATITKGSGAGPASGTGGGIGKVGLINPDGAEPIGAARQAEGVMAIGTEGKDVSALSKANEGATQADKGDGGLGVNAALAGAAAQSSTAMQQTLETVKDKAAEVIESVGGLPALGTGTGTGSKADDKLLSPSSASAGAKADAQAGRRLSKEDIAAEMRSADTVDGLLESLGRASGEGRDKEKEKVD